MTYTIHVPFGMFTFKNALPKHIAYFKSQFLEVSYSLPNKISVEVIFRKRIIEPLSSLEGRYFSDENYCYIADTRGKLAGLDVNKLMNRQYTLIVDPDFDPFYLYSFLLEPLYIVEAAAHGILFLHASAVANHREQATVFSAWRHTGKTDSILQLSKQGYVFLGDDYCVLHKNKTYLYPKKINVFSYNLKRFPDVYRTLPLHLHMRLRLTTMCKEALEFLAQKMPRNAAKVCHRLAELAEVSTNIKVDPKAIGIDYVASADIHKIILLEKASASREVSHHVSPGQLIDKIVLILQFELNDFFQIYKVLRYLFSEIQVPIIESYELNVRKLLQEHTKHMQLFVFNNISTLSNQV